MGGGGRGIGSWVTLRVDSSLSGEYHHSINLSVNRRTGKVTDTILCIELCKYNIIHVNTYVHVHIQIYIIPLRRTPLSILQFIIIVNTILRY